ncbi:acid phosphatase 1-like [Salvia divinorum]|uniref:Acid phosphatase 1-like n=1 Tax=Salvia divinorum TaxID=28513 RepID=A0ABD1HFR6_SALDI
MAFIQWGLITLIVILSAGPTWSAPSIIQMRPEKETLLDAAGRRKSDHLYCSSWRFTVETNDAGAWTRVPARCVNFVKEYITGDLYASELEAVAANAAEYAREIGVSGDGRDAWVFDIDETLLSNVPYYAVNGFGSQIFDEPSFNEWVELTEAPAIVPGLRLYKELQHLGFTLFLLTGRGEYQRHATERNLMYAGFTNWEKLIVRGNADKGKPASVFKSEKRKEIEDAGYIIHGSSGDQWSDLMGFALARRSFKLPNPLYYIA